MSATIDYSALLRAMYFTPGLLHKTIRNSAGERMRNWGAPGGVLLWGPPGGGKTSALEALAEEVGGACFILDSTVGEGALGATPIPDMDAKVLRFFPADFLDTFAETPGVFGVDDMTTFQPGLQSYLLGMLLNKRIGSSYLPPNVRVFGAANEPLDAPGGFELANSVTNRCCHIDFPDAPVEDWCANLATQFEVRPNRKIDAHKEEQRVLKVFPSQYARAAGLMSAFSLAKRDMHREKLAEGHSKKAYFTPRTKAFATIALASSAVHGLNEASTEAFVAGYVGEAFAVELSTFVREMDLPDAAAFLDGTVKFEHKAFRIDRTAALLHSCAALVIPTNAEKRVSRLNAFYGFADAVSEDCLDSIAHIIVSQFYDYDREGLVLSVKSANPITRKLRPMLEATEAART